MRSLGQGHSGSSLNAAAQAPSGRKARRLKREGERRVRHGLGPRPACVVEAEAFMLAECSDPISSGGLCRSAVSGAESSAHAG